LRQIQARQHETKTGGDMSGETEIREKTLPGVNTEAEKITGRVTDYITIEENLS